MIFITLYIFITLLYLLYLTLYDVYKTLNNTKYFSKITFLKKDKKDDKFTALPEEKTVVSILFITSKHYKMNVFIKSS